MAKNQAVAYLRVSGRGQVDGDGFPRQRDAVAKYARRAGYELVGEYRDEGVSGATELADRPGLAELVDRIRSNGVRVVIVERADRLARDLLVSEVILGEFRRLGVAVFDASGTDLAVSDDDPTRRLIRQVLSAVAEFDKAVTVAKLRAARQRVRRTTGRCEGVKPYGTLPGEAEGLAMLRQLARKPKGKPARSHAAIAAELTARGVPTRKGRPWRPSSVGAILRAAR